MKQIITLVFGILLITQAFACKSKGNKVHIETEPTPAAENLSTYLTLLKNKKVGLIVNHTSTINKTHLLDTLLSSGINVVKVFAPEHGFRGNADAGAHIDNSRDPKTGIPIISLYGKNKLPSKEDLNTLDLLVYDIQDIGVRFYTYSSTLHYVIGAVSENDKELIILDRPNPNGHYVAGPVLEKEFSSFVGLNPIPIVYGLTSGELAKMIDGEHWASSKKCKLTVIPCEAYNHNSKYNLPVKPSPNLPNNQAINLYPSICGFEPTQISVGRGTDKQFQVIGGPDKKLGNFTFTPEDKPGAMNPVNKGKLCYGIDLSGIDAYSDRFSLKYLISFYAAFSEKDKFFTNEKFFNLLMGNSWILADIKNGLGEKEISEKWSSDLENYKKLRKKYLLYTDFE